MIYPEPNMYTDIVHHQIKITLLFELQRNILYIFLIEMYLNKNIYLHFQFKNVFILNMVIIVVLPTININL